ncbi:DUF4446 family protein [Clostridium aestuarii]|uniref:DUF4446 family protein n=1 Tax=Clostridium aestuarii TaxID=338193 RepID=A0ABT4D288_9CLOT|nr:DUF4446 family protein [Clostridium aestuarii]MCY6485359.1 DUF4446 family protein [Clostridium aestuarii]
MKGIIGFFSDLQPYILMGFVIIIIILIITLLVVLKSINRLETRYRKLTRGINNENLEKIIMSYLDNIDKVKEDTEKIKNQQQEINNNLKQCIQKVSILRYKAFEDIGSDLSFSIVLLDNSNDGVVLTGIYGRSDSTVYAKPIDKGISRYDLSEEEEEVLYNAIKKQ